jgi:flagellar protein FliS
MSNPPPLSRAQQVARAYARVGVESNVTGADAHQRILLLFDGALRAVADARVHLDARRIAEKGAAVSRTLAIIEQGLEQAVDRDRGGAIAENLLALYDYAKRRLLAGNLDNDSAAFAEVAALLLPLRDAWASISAAVHATPSSTPPTRR